MYFVKQGTVSIQLEEFENYSILYIRSGEYFGEEDLMFGETHMYTYKAETDCELLLLDKKFFTKIFFNEFRDIGRFLVFIFRHVFV